MRTIMTSVGTLTLSVLSGCASVNSTMSGSAADGGLVYFMPMRDIAITVTSSGGKISSIAVA